MATETQGGRTLSFEFYHATATKAIPPYTPVSLDATGLKVQLPTLSSNKATTKIIGVTLGWALVGHKVAVQLDGIVRVFVDKSQAIVTTKMVHVHDVPASITYITKPFGVTGDPFSLLPVASLPVNPNTMYGGIGDVAFAVCANQTVTLSTSLTTTINYPVGWPLDAVSSDSDNYQIISVLLDTGMFYA